MSEARSPGAQDAAAQMERARLFPKWVSRLSPFWLELRGVDHPGGTAPSMVGIIPVSSMEEEYGWLDIIAPGCRVQRVETLANRLAAFDLIEIRRVDGSQTIVVFDVRRAMDPLPE